MVINYIECGEKKDLTTSFDAMKKWEFFLKICNLFPPLWHARSIKTLFGLFYMWNQRISFRNDSKLLRIEIFRIIVDQMENCEAICCFKLVKLSKIPLYCSLSIEISQNIAKKHKFVTGRCYTVCFVILIMQAPLLDQSSVEYRWSENS